MLGRKDALALLGFSTAALIASPWLAGSALIGVAGIIPAFSSHHIISTILKKRLYRVDSESKEDFVLDSDESYTSDTCSMELGNAFRIGYSKKDYTPVDIPMDAWRRHTLVVGQSGVGKTTLGEFIIYQQIMLGGGLCFIDGKLDVATRDHIGFMMYISGRSDEFQIINTDDPDNSNTYNPCLDGDSGDITSRLMNMVPVGNAGTDHYRQAAIQALNAVTEALLSANILFTMEDISMILTSPKAYEAILRYDISPSARRALELMLESYKKKDQRGMQNLDADKLKTNLAGIAGRLQEFGKGSFGKIFNTYEPEVRLFDTITKNKVLYIMLQTMGKLDLSNNLAKIILSDTRYAISKIQALKKADRPNPPYVFFWDEFGSYALDATKTLFEQIRSANGVLIPAFQTLANLNAVSDDFTDVVVGNTWNKIFFKLGSLETSETSAQILGMLKKAIKSMSQSETEGSSSQNLRGTPQGNGSKGGGIAYSWRISEEYIVSPDHLRRLSIGECIVLCGARVYHVITPMLDWDAVKKDIRPFKPFKIKVSVDPNKTPFNGAERYKEFITGTVGA